MNSDNELIIKKSIIHGFYEKNNVSTINNGTINTNNTKTENSNNVTNNIQINSFGKEDISYLDGDYFKNLIMNQHIEKGYVQLIKDIYLNKEHPENGTVQISTMQLISIPEGQGCTVQWQFEQEVGWWPWERLGSMMNEKIMGPQLQTNLQRLSDHLLTTP
jgi:hypothetical protein